MRIRWTEPAAHDLTLICDYIEEHDGPEAARKVALRIYEGIGRLNPFPYRGRPGRKKNIARWSFPGFLFSPSTACAGMLLKSAASYTARRSGPTLLFPAAPARV
jgi:hypothetical protein